MPPSALSLPLLFVSLMTVLGFAVRFARARMFRAMLDWWISLGLVLIVTALAAIIPATRPLAGALSFAALVALVLLPLYFERRSQRAARLAQKGLAVFFARLAALLHPSRRNRAQPEALRALLALREGRELSAQEIESLSDGEPLVAHALALLVAHNRGDIRAVHEAMISAEQRAALYAMGMGLVHLRAVALLDPSPEELVRAIAEVSALDPTMRDPDRRALLAAFALAYLGDREGALEASRGLSAYLAPGEADAVRALALFCAGDAEGAQKTLREAIASHAQHPAAVHALETLSHVLHAARPRSASLYAPSLSELVTRLRAEARALAVIAPLEGRTSTPWLTLAWSLVLVLAYGWLSLRGDPYDPALLARSGGLLTSDFAMLGDLRTAWPMLFTHGLLHAGVLHLAFNLLALAVFGRFCEAFYGRTKTALLYALAAASSGLAVAYTADVVRPTVLVGASGSIFALGGAVLAAVLVDRDLRATPRGKHELRSLVGLFLTQMLIDRLVPGISGTAHVAGLVTGLALGAALTALRRGRAR